MLCANYPLIHSRCAKTYSLVGRPADPVHADSRRKLFGLRARSRYHARHRDPTHPAPGRGTGQARCHAFRGRLRADLGRPQRTDSSPADGAIRRPADARNRRHRQRRVRRGTHCRHGSAGQPLPDAALAGPVCGASGYRGPSGTRRPRRQPGPAARAPGRAAGAAEGGRHRGPARRHGAVRAIRVGRRAHGRKYPAVRPAR